VLTSHIEMTDIAIRDAARANELLAALGDQVHARGEHFSIAVVGGSALLALELTSRATTDVDVVGLLDGVSITSAEPLPDGLLHAARVVARDFTLTESWLNAGPTSLLDLGLPDGFYERAEHRQYGPGLSVAFASRLDQIHLKLYATVDQGVGKHLTDLRALDPTAGELLAAAAWSETHDISEGYRDELTRILTHLGVDRGPADA
jgi:hypothetical protein